MIEALFFVGGLVFGAGGAVIAMALGAKFMYKSIYREDIPFLNIRPKNFKPSVKSDAQVEEAEAITGNSKYDKKLPTYFNDQLKELAEAHR